MQHCVLARRYPFVHFAVCSKRMHLFALELTTRATLTFMALTRLEEADGFRSTSSTFITIILKGKFPRLRRPLPQSPFHQSIMVRCTTRLAARRAVPLLRLFIASASLLLLAQQSAHTEFVVMARIPDEDGPHPKADDDNHGDPAMRFDGV